MKDGNGEVVLGFKLDYISADASRPSGHRSLGVTGGDGSVSVGDESAIVKWSTSLDRNLNERGYGEYTKDSPATDEDFSPNPDTPEWDYRVVYEAWVDASVFGGAGFGGAFIEYVHASPAKSESETIEVTPGECPPPDCLEGDPDADCGPGDTDPPGEQPPGCIDNDPDTFCGEAGSGPGEDPCTDDDPETTCNDGDPLYCVENSDDPACKVD